jgi:probable DNA repair protein
LSASKQNSTKSKFDWLNDATRDGAQVLSASRRLARVLTKTHAEQQVAAGKVAWEVPRISEWRDWAADLVLGSTEFKSAPIVISHQQSRILWERCLRREVSDPLLNLGTLAKQSRDAWNRLREWRVPLSRCEQMARNRDQRLFAVAAGYYQSILVREDWVDETGMVEFAIEHLKAGSATPSRSLTLAGFDRLSPLLQQLLDACAEAGGEVHRLDPVDKTQTNNVRLACLENSDVELRSAGAWAKQQLQKDPDAQIGIVVSQLEQDAQRNLRLIKEGLIPGWQNASPRQNAVVNVSYGRKLSDYPAIATALLLIRWLSEDLTTTELSHLLRSTLIGSGGDDQHARAELKLRNLPEQGWSATMLRDYFWREDEDPQQIAHGLDFVSVIAKQQEQLPKRQSPGNWVALFDNVLRESGWPGAGTLSSDDFQTINRWRELLNEVARLELVSDSMTLSEALARVLTIATETVFQPENTESSVNVMGPLEAAGQQFDVLWVSGASSANWPPQSRALSMVSRELQREYGLPDSTPEDTLAYAGRVLDRLATSAAAVTFSYPQALQDAQQSASELLSAYDIVDLTDLDPGWHAASLCDRVPVVDEKCDPVPTLAESESIAGGAATIQNQLVEPFTAFVSGRLGIRNLWPIEAGLPPNIRGSLIHKALQHLYADRPGSSEIRLWDDATIDELTGKAVAAAFRVAEQHADATHLQLLRLERIRVQRLLRGVILEDAKRDSFTISAVEQDVKTTISGLPLHLRIDRIDLDADGQKIVIDYKTGAAKRLLDRDKTPKDMQLVVYACALPDAISGIGLFNVDSRSIALDAAGREFSPAIDWDEAFLDWTKQVEVAASEIVAGDVRLNAAYSIQQSRPFALLSRVRELQHEQ